MARSTVRFSLPSIADVTDAIYTHWNSQHLAALECTQDSEYGPGNPEADTYLDVRVWARDTTEGFHRSHGIEFGDVQYDTTHGDVCASGCFDLTEEPTLKASRKIARELCAELRAQAAEFRANHEGR